MENWGLVTYRKVLLLFDEHTTPVIYKQRIAYVVGHELVCDAP
jgi:aminopeptidase 2